VEVAEGLVRLVQSALEAPRVMLVLPDRLGLRVMLVNADLPDQKALEVFRVPLDLLAVELEEPRYLAPRVMLVPPDLLDPRARMEQLAQLGHLDPKALPDLQESVVPPVRMQSPLSSTGISLRTRQPRPTARRRTSRMHSDRLIRSRMVPGIIRQ